MSKSTKKKPQESVEKKIIKGRTFYTITSAKGKRITLTDQEFEQREAERQEEAEK